MQTDALKNPHLMKKIYMISTAFEKQQVQRNCSPVAATVLRTHSRIQSAAAWICSQIAELSPLFRIRVIAFVYVANANGARIGNHSATIFDNLSILARNLMALRRRKRTTKCMFECKYESRVISACCASRSSQAWGCMATIAHPCSG